MTFVAFTVLSGCPKTLSRPSCHLRIPKNVPSVSNPTEVVLGIVPTARNGNTTMLTGTVTITGERTVSATLADNGTELLAPGDTFQIRLGSTTPASSWGVAQTTNLAVSITVYGTWAGRGDRL